MDSSSSCCVFNVEEEVVVIRNGWTPKKKEMVVLMLLLLFGLQVYVQCIYDDVDTSGMGERESEGVLYMFLGLCW